MGKQTISKEAATIRKFEVIVSDGIPFIIDN